jgi:hypothetical protein
MTFNRTDWEVIRKMNMGCRWELLPESDAPVGVPIQRQFPIIDIEKTINFVPNENNGRETGVRDVGSKVERPEKKTRPVSKSVSNRKPRTKKG